MTPINALWHLLNLFLPALLMGLVAGSAVKLLWRRELRSVPLTRLAGSAMFATVTVTLGGLVVLGQDGRLATYGAMVLGCALTLWWQGFWRRR